MSRDGLHPDVTPQPDRAPHTGRVGSAELPDEERKRVEAEHAERVKAEAAAEAEADRQSKRAHRASPPPVEQATKAPGERRDAHRGE